MRGSEHGRPHPAARPGGKPPVHARSIFAYFVLPGLALSAWVCPVGVAPADMGYGGRRPWPPRRRCWAREQIRRTRIYNIMCFLAPGKALGPLLGAPTIRPIASGPRTTRRPATFGAKTAEYRRTPSPELFERSVRSEMALLRRFTLDFLITDPI